MVFDQVNEKLISLKWLYSIRQPYGRRGTVSVKKELDKIVVNILLMMEEKIRPRHSAGQIATGHGFPLRINYP